MLMEEPIQELEEALLKVREILEQDQESRNSDLRLVLLFWKSQGIDINKLLTLTSFMTTPETITRVRRQIQNDENDLLPTDPQILIKRRIKEEAIRNYYGANNRTLMQWTSLKYKVI